MVYIFYRNVISDYSETRDLIQWVKEHCPSYITNTFDKDTFRYEFRFGNEKDLVACTLRWS